MYKLGRESNLIKEFNVTIDGIKITNGQLLSLKILWDIDDFKVTGELVMLDPTNLVEEIPIRGNNTVNISLTDYDDKVLTHQFKIINVQYTRNRSDESDNNLILELIDKVSLKSLQLYKKKSWETTDIVEILNDVTIIGGDLNDKEKDFFSPSIKYNKFIIPLNNHFYSLMNWMKSSYNVKWFQTRKKYILQPIKELFGRSKKGKKFIYKANNKYYRRNIYEFNLKQGNLLKLNTFQPDGKINTLDVKNKKINIINNSYKSIGGEINSVGNVDLNLPGTKGKKLFYLSNTNKEKLSKDMWSKNTYKNNEMEILVPGQFETNIGDIVEVDFVNLFNASGPEKNLNGLWLVGSIVDVIIPPEFIQRITLRRNKFST